MLILFNSDKERYVNVNFNLGTPPKMSCDIKMPKRISNGLKGKSTLHLTIIC